MAEQSTLHPRKTSLRALAKPKSAIETLAPKPKEIIRARRRKEDAMHALALELGYFCTPSSEFLSNLAFRIASSIVTRGGKFVYQSAAFSIQGFPLELARQTLALAATDLDTPEGTTV